MKDHKKDKLEEKEHMNGGDRQAMKVKNPAADPTYANDVGRDTPERDASEEHTGKKIHTILDDKSVKKSVEEALKHDEERLGQAKKKAQDKDKQ